MSRPKCSANLHLLRHLHFELNRFAAWICETPWIIKNPACYQDGWRRRTEKSETNQKWWRKIQTKVDLTEVKRRQTTATGDDPIERALLTLVEWWEEDWERRKTRRGEEFDGKGTEKDSCGCAGVTEEEQPKKIAMCVSWTTPASTELARQDTTRKW